MRTTLTIDDEIALRLKESAARDGVPFKVVVNEALRAGLGLRNKPNTSPPPFEIETFSSAFRGGIDEGKLNQVLDQLDAESFADGCDRAGK